VDVESDVERVDVCGRCGGDEAGRGGVDILYGGCVGGEGYREGA